MLAHWVTAGRTHSRLEGCVRRARDATSAQDLQTPHATRARPDAEASSGGVTRRRRLRPRPPPPVAAPLPQERGLGGCWPHADAEKARRDSRGAGLTHLPANNLGPDLSFLERKCPRLYPAPGLHYPECPRGSASAFTQLLDYISQNAP